MACLNRQAWDSGGALDIVLVHAEDGSVGSTDWHVVFDSRLVEEAVTTVINGTAADGFEMQFGTNHLGHFAWTAQLMPALAQGARVVTLSSAAHLRGSVDLDDLNWKARDYDPNLAYAQSKTANIWFASEFQRRFDGRLLSLSVHPGVIETDLARHLPEAVVAAMRINFKEAGIIPKNVAQGAATSVWAATSSDLVGHGGAYLLDAQIATPVTEEEPRTGYAPWAYDAAGAGRLWTQSEELTSVSFA